MVLKLFISLLNIQRNENQLLTLNVVHKITYICNNLINKFEILYTQ